ncbi:hypothetical protein ASD37_22610 [Mycobacterium sp. Root135]|uniref:hypothetical protein n=1 Tax=Mycobacterium sp. Root135 TaxID=1736457 RepID=UPI0006FB1750|nr:hypothetical protein [Mycobacterium sp. Root135]KQY04894.1 hypothetical protein ASD37_22610 [Mycobacterium sp. Root135]
MANPYDVAARLVEGRPAVDDVEEYVAACRRLGYQHPDLTTHSAQVRDWYSGDDGLDLRALDSDHVVLAAAASAAEDAARMQADLMTELDGAWSGRGATAAHEFLYRSCQSATAVSAAVRTAADAVAALRDALWQAVDAKVLATEAVDGTQQPRRAEWMAAAATVTTGVGDVAAASELIDLEVTPFVDLEVGAEWVAAMRQAAAAVDSAYGAAIARITAPVAVFGVPGVLGPRDDRVATERPQTTPAVASRPEPVAVQAMPVQTVPAAAVGSAPAAVAPAAAPWSGTEAATAPPPAPPLSPPPVPSSGDLGAGAPSLGSMGSAGSGLGGFGQQLADLIGGLVGSGGDLAGSSDPSYPADLDEDLDEPPDDEDPEEDEETESGEEDGKAEEGEGVAEPQEPEEAAADVAAEPPPAPEPAPTPPPAVQDLPDATAQPLVGDSEPTPCEIAADELPQVGE